jgi:hypothetical protein
MSKVERTVYLISEQQREALLGYLQNRPYREVAAGIQFLVNAPTASVNVEIPNEEINNLAEGNESSNDDSAVETRELAAV